jgi:hypothetical protein
MGTREVGKCQDGREVQELVSMTEVQHMWVGMSVFFLLSVHNPGPAV